MAVTMATRQHNPFRQIPEQRRIIDRSALMQEIDNLIDEYHTPQTLRSASLALLKDALENGQTEIRRRFDQDEADGRLTAMSLAFLADQIIRVTHDIAALHLYPAANPTRTDRLTVAAVGGYGRGELAPHSDIDLLFLLPYKETPRQEQVIEFILYMLWDLKFKVGHSVRSVDNCLRLARSDLTIKTALLEARCLWGDRQLFGELRHRFLNEVVKDNGPDFVEAKLAERDARHKRMGDSRYVLEPNIKEGKGGLRDLQTLYWIGKYLYRIDDVSNLVGCKVLTEKEASRFERAHRYLWEVRCHLHYATGRGEDTLTFDLQPQIASLLGYRNRATAKSVERFMKRYYLVAKEIGNLTRIFCAALEAEHQRKSRFRLPSLEWLRKAPEGFVYDGGRLSVKSGRVLRENPVKILEMFHTAQQEQVDIHPKALRTVTRNLSLIDGIRDDESANRLFLEMLTSSRDAEITLRRLNESGVFGRFVPDFGRVVAQMQHDMYHVFTVDEHTVFAVGILHGIEDGKYAREMPTATRAIRKIASRRALYVAILLHDIAKGRGGDHSELGAEIAQNLGPRFGLTEEETDTAEWLVRYHLLMSNTAFRRDLDDPQTVTDFCAIVQSVERLRLLLTLTCADIRAVGPNVWNAWKSSLLGELYDIAEERLTGTSRVGGRPERVAQAQAAMRAKLPDLSDDAIEAHVARGTEAYWLSLNAETHAWHARLVHEAEAGAQDLTISNRIDDERAATAIAVYAPDHHGFFSRIAGAMAISGASIVDAKIFTTHDGMALDTFWVQDAAGGPLKRRDKLARLYVRIEQTLAGQLRPRSELENVSSIPSRTRVFKVAPRILIDNNASRTHTVIEVEARDRTGLLYDLTRCLSSLSLQIGSAHIATFGETAIDVFYVKDIFGLQITHERKLDEIRTSLLNVIADRDPTLVIDDGQIAGQQETPPATGKSAERIPA